MRRERRRKFPSGGSERGERLNDSERWCGEGWGGNGRGGVMWLISNALLHRILVEQ